MIDVTFHKLEVAGRNIGQEIQELQNEKGNSPGLQTYKNHMCMW